LLVPVHDVEEVPPFDNTGLDWIGLNYSGKGRQSRYASCYGSDPIYSEGYSVHGFVSVHSLGIDYGW